MKDFGTSVAKSNDSNDKQKLKDEEERKRLASVRYSANSRSPNSIAKVKMPLINLNGQKKGKDSFELAKMDDSHLDRSKMDEYNVSEHNIHKKKNKGLFKIISHRYFRTIPRLYELK